MSGQFTFFFATKVPAKELSLCSVGVFGTSYIRKEPIKSSFEIKTKSKSIINVPHVFEEDAIVNQLKVNLRQKAGYNLPFVTLINGADSTDVVINATNVNPGRYILVLESFDLNNSTLPNLTLKTDTITITVIEADDNSTQELPTKVLTVGEPESWKLPSTEDGDYKLLDLVSFLQPFITFEEKTGTI